MAKKVFLIDWQRGIGLNKSAKSFHSLNPHFTEHTQLWQDVEELRADWRSEIQVQKDKIKSSLSTSRQNIAIKKGTRMKCYFRWGVQAHHTGSWVRWSLWGSHTAGWIPPDTGPRWSKHRSYTPLKHKKKEIKKKNTNVNAKKPSFPAAFEIVTWDQQKRDSFVITSWRKSAMWQLWKCCKLPATKRKVSHLRGYLTKWLQVECTFPVWDVGTTPAHFCPKGPKGFLLKSLSSNLG